MMIDDDGEFGALPRTIAVDFVSHEDPPAQLASCAGAGEFETGFLYNWVTISEVVFRGAHPERSCCGCVIHLDPLLPPLRVSFEGF